MLEQISAIGDLASLVITALALYYARTSAPARELWAAAAMFLVSAASQVVVLCADVLRGSSWDRLILDAVLLTGLLALAWITWGRADRAGELDGDAEGDLW